MKLRLEQQNALSEWTQFYVQHEPRVRAILIKICRSRDVDDLVQESFLKIWQGLHGLQTEAALKAWIAKVTINTALDHFRRKAVRPITEEFLDDKIGFEPESERPTESLGEAMNVLRRLKPAHREVLLLSVIEEKSIEEVASLLHISPGTVKSRLFHARQNLRRTLKKRAC